MMPKALHFPQKDRKQSFCSGPRRQWSIVFDDGGAGIDWTGLELNEQVKAGQHFWHMWAPDSSEGPVIQLAIFMTERWGSSRACWRTEHIDALFF